MRPVARKFLSLTFVRNHVPQVVVMKKLFLWLLPLCCLSCGGPRETDRQLEEARSLLCDAPAEALQRLQCLRPEQLRRPRLQAKYALLYTQALNKNQRQPTSDSLIRLAVEYYDCVGDPHESAMAYYYLGQYLHDAASNPYKAAEALFTARALASRTEDDYLKGLIDVAIGTIYMEQYGFVEAVSYLDSGEHYLRTQGGTPRNLAIVAELKASAYKRLKRTEQADSCYQQAMALLEEHHFESDLFRVRWRYVSVIEERYGADSAFRYLESLYARAAVPGSRESEQLAPLYDQWGLLLGLHYSAGDVDSVRYYGEKCLKEGYYRSGRALMECLNVLEEVEFRAGNYRKARAYAVRYVQLQDSLHGSQYVYFMQAIDEQRQNEILTQMNYRLREQSRLQWLMLCGIGVVLVALVALGVYAVRRWRARGRRREQQMRAEMEALQRSYRQMCDQLGLLRQHDEGKNEQEAQLYKALEERLIGLRDLMTVFQMGKPSDFASNFRRYAEVNLTSRYALSELQFVVNHKYHGMIDYLKQHYPELNKHDLDLCGLLCLGFSQQGICFMYGYDDIGSFYNRRSRLRRKLHLPPDARIEDFVMELMQQLKARDDERQKDQ